MPSKSGRRRQLARLRAEFSSKPLMIDPNFLGEISRCLADGDLPGISAALFPNSSEIPSQTQILNGIAVIPVSGALRDEPDWMVRYYGACCYQLLERDIARAIENESVSGIVLWMNTPGGQALGVKRLSDSIYSLRGKKPIVAYTQSLCASAGYYIAAACDRIEATSDAMVGSIGVIMTHLEISKLAKDLGYGPTVLTNKDSPLKGHGNTWEPLSGQAKKTLQDHVDTIGTQFIESIATYRGISKKKVIDSYGQGNFFVGSEAIKRGMVDFVVADVSETLKRIDSTNKSSQVIAESTGDDDDDGEDYEPTTKSQSSDIFISEKGKNVKRVNAQLFAMGLISDINAAAEIVNGILAAFFAARGQSVPTEESVILSALQGSPAAAAAAAPEKKTEAQLQQSRASEYEEARAEALAESKTTVDELRASAALVNKAAGREVITSDMVLDATREGLSTKAAVEKWNAKLAKEEESLAQPKVVVISEGYQRWAEDVTSALLYRATSTGSRPRRGPAGQQTSGVRVAELSSGASTHVAKPIWAIAAECLQMNGQKVDMFGDRELICRSAMELGTTGLRHTFFSEHEGRQYVGAAAGIPFARPGDFPNLLSNLANKFMDSIELDEWTYPEFSAVWPTGFGDFKPTSMVNHGTPDELDEILDSGEFNNLQKSEEVLSYIFCRRFGNKWGWTPVLLANDDLGAFAEGMLGLDEAWETTQHRLCLNLIMANPTLLDGSALFANRTQGNNDRAAGGAPSDAEWAAMETLYADIKGISPTARRVRGSLNTILTPTGTQHQEARRTFMPLNAGVEPKMAATTANVGLYRGQISIIPEPELRDDSTATRYYGMRSPTQLRTATIVRGYFNGFGAAGRRERWYDPADKTTWISIEGRIGVAIKNWRYVIRNKGAA